jgi:tetratricopeptide (TPR) repeat protein
MSLSVSTNRAISTAAKPTSGLRAAKTSRVLAGLLAAWFHVASASVEEEQPTYVSPDEPVNEYLDAIDRIESEYGPYATELSDMYLGLGQTLMDLGEYEKARDAFNRGVMVVRVNSGPNSPEQTNHLYLLANIETVLGEYKAANKVLRTIYFINSDHYGEESVELLPVLERMYQWYMTTRPLDTGMTKFEDYERAIELTEEMVRVSKAVKGSTDSYTALSYQRLGEAQFRAARYLDGLDLNLYSSVRVTAGPYFDAGRRAFEKYLQALAANPDTTPPQFAEAVANLADWYTDFENPGKSRDLYLLGYKTLAQSEEYAELAERYMNHPEPVYFIDNPQQIYLVDAPEDFQETKIDISMTVTSTGNVRNIEVLNAPEALSKDDLRDIEKYLQSTTFRPAMKEGDVVTTKDFIWQSSIVPLRAAS